MQEPKTVQFSIKNNNLYQTEVTLFDVNSLSLGLGSNITLNGSSVDYNFFVQTLNDNPKLIFDILVKMPQVFLVNPINVIYTDANGESNTIPYLPNTDIDVYQKSPNRGSIKFDNGLILNVNTKLQITLPPLFTVILLIDYREFLKSDMLDAVIYNKDNKAKYLINQSLVDGKISALKYWGSKKMPKQISLSVDWVKDLKDKFKKVEIIEYDQPKLAGGNILMKNIYKNLFGFKNYIKKKSE